jgi:glycosyltransferase involved in cell wall biosynthesis
MSFTKTVSILTITQNVRYDCILVLYEMIKLQLYKNIKEWVLVEGSNNKDDADENKIKLSNFIDNIKDECNFTIKYVEFTKPQKLGGLRNCGNANCSSDIIVCMDDDDYYPPERISHAVDVLSNSDKLIAGVSDVYLYDFFLDKLYKFKGFMDFHSTNNCMAYKKEFLINNKHDLDIQVGEERSFTIEFTRPLEKLNSRKTIIAISHNFNTFNKRELCLGGTLKTLPTLDEIQEPITNYINPEIYKKMKKIFYKEEKSKYDLVYLLGSFCRKFHPNDKNLDVEEVAVIKLCNYWKNNGYNIAVYGDFEETITVDGIDYIHWKNFPFNHLHKIVILWRSNGFLTFTPFPIKAEKIYWDLHDNIVNDIKLLEFYPLYANKINKYFFKSNYHKIEFDKYLQSKNLKAVDYHIIPSGVRIETFSNNYDDVERNPYRFSYITGYDRGGKYLIDSIFSVIKQIEPRAEFHFYGSMDLINDENFKKDMNKSFANHGVCDHGRVSEDIISREMFMSSFILYIANIVNEVEPVHIKEAIVSGTIPLVANFGVFQEREGIKFNVNHNEPKNLKMIALQILNLMKDQNKLNEIRNNFRNSPTIISWDNIGYLWKQII